MKRFTRAPKGPTRQGSISLPTAILANHASKEKKPLMHGKLLINIKSAKGN